MANSSSARKVARLAQKGKGRKVRFQGGTLFPSVMAIVIVLGLVLVGFARQSAPDTNEPPTINDHWHVSYGFYACDQFIDDLKGTLEDEPIDPNYLKYGVHSHEDGVIHWHPQALATGRRAKLGVFFDSYSLKVSPDGIEFPLAQNDGKSYAVGTDKCKDKSGKEVDAKVQVVVWESYDKADVSKKYIADFDNIRIDKDQMAITIAYIAPGTEIPMPPSAANLPELGAVDAGAPAPTTTVAGSATTVAGSQTTTTVAGSPTTTTVASDTTGG